MKQPTSKPQINQSQNKQNQCSFQLGGENHLTISSQFQCGNIRVVRQVSSEEYILQSVKDPNIYSKKSWFYFKMTCTMTKTIKIVIQNANIFESMIDKDCAIVCRNEKQNEWKNIKVTLIEELTNKNTLQLSLSFQYKFVANQTFYFSLSVPFSYTDNQLYFERLKTKIPEKISYKDQLLALTPENREVRLITISQYSEEEQKSQKHKPIILVTSRIHPGEVTASFCMLGMIETLLNPNSLMSYILRRLFQWKIVPMVNPDGVVVGNYRTDPQGQNLNRHYLQPDPYFHPAIHCIANLMKDITESNQKIQFYFDLHSHSSMKEAFIYGNAFEKVDAQAYSRLFCKILEENTLYFKNNLCQFGTKHMKYKDRGEKMSKQGCGRVSALKVAKVIRSYTLQSTIMPIFYSKIDTKTGLLPIKNQKLKYQPPGYPTILSYHEDSSGSTQQHILIKANKALGQAVLVSILDMFQKNPFSRLSENFHEKQYLALKKRLIRFEQRFKLKQAYLGFKSALNYHKIVQQFQRQIYQNWQKSNINNQFYCTMHQPIDFRFSKQQLKSKRAKRSLHYKSNESILQHQSISKLQNHLQLTNEEINSSHEEKLSKLKVKLKTKLKHHSPYLNIKSLISQSEQITSNDSQPSISKNNLPFPYQCFLQPSQRLKSIKSQMSDITAVPQFLNQNLKIFQVQGRKNTPLVKSFKEDSLSKKNEDKLNMSNLAKIKKVKVGNFYLAFLQRRKRTKTESKNEIQLVPDISLPRSYSSLNNKLLPLSSNKPNKEKAFQSLSKVSEVAGSHHSKKPINTPLNLPSLDIATRVLKKRRLIFTQKN